MSEYLATHLTIGGPVLRRHVARLLTAIGRENLSLNWGETLFSPRSAAELLDARIEMGGVSVLRLYDEQARWGQFAELERLLIRYQVTFDRQNEGKYEINPERFSYRPGSEGVAYLTNAQERIVVEAEPLEKIVDQLAAARRAVCQPDSRLALRKLAAMSRVLRRSLPQPLPPLTSLEIVPSRRPLRRRRPPAS